MPRNRLREQPRGWRACKTLQTVTRGASYEKGRMRSAKDHAIMGRPKKSEPRSKQLNMSLTVGELENIRKRAEALGMRPVHFARALLLDQGRQLAASHEPSDNMERLI